MASLAAHDAAAPACRLQGLAKSGFWLCMQRLFKVSESLDPFPGSREEVSMCRGRQHTKGASMM